MALSVAIMAGALDLAAAQTRRTATPRPTHTPTPTRTATPTPTPIGFSNPERVRILGYSDDAGNHNVAMEPFISRDGKYLFFNNSNNPKVDTNLFWSTRVDDVDFQFQGELGGVNSTALDAVASMDINNNFFFITTRSYFTQDQPGYLTTIYSGPFADGGVTPVGPVPGLAAPRLGHIDFDAEISADGNMLYYTEGVFTGGSVPSSARIKIARRNGETFEPDPNSAALMANIDNNQLNYAADTSASELELYFTRLGGNGPQIFMATRASTAMPFGKPQKITAIIGFAEAPSISPDGRSLYYHFLDKGVFVINRVTRP